MIPKNINTSGRVIRFSIGILLLIYAYVQMSWIALGLAAFTFFEALMSWCVFYQLIGKNSCPLDKRPRK